MTHSHHPRVPPPPAAAPGYLSCAGVCAAAAAAPHALAGGVRAPPPADCGCGEGEWHCSLFGCASCFSYAPPPLAHRVRLRTARCPPVPQPAAPGPGPDCCCCCAPRSPAQIWAAFVATLLPQQHIELLASASRRHPPCAALAHAGAAFAAQLVLHALGEPGRRPAAPLAAPSLLLCLC